jgi:hypothetical protein
MVGVVVGDQDKVGLGWGAGKLERINVDDLPLRNPKAVMPQPANVNALIIPHDVSLLFQGVEHCLQLSCLRPDVAAKPPLEEATMVYRLFKSILAPALPDLNP